MPRSRGIKADDHNEKLPSKTLMQALDIVVIHFPITFEKWNAFLLITFLVQQFTLGTTKQRGCGCDFERQMVV